MKYLKFEKRDHVGFVAVEKSGSGDGIDLALARELHDVCRQINDDPGARAIIMRLAGKTSPPNQPDDPMAADIASRTVAGIRVPVIAALEGEVLGTALELVLAADIRLAAEGARFGLLQVSQGAIPAGGGTQRLPRIVGRGKALEMILTAEIVDAAEAYRIGLVNKVLPTAELYTYAEGMASKIASKGPIGERYAKEAIGKGLDMTLEQGLRLEADLSFLLHSTRDRTEGINAFLEKRTPKFEGE